MSRSLENFPHANRSVWGSLVFGVVAGATWLGLAQVAPAATAGKPAVARSATVSPLPDVNLRIDLRQVDEAVLDEPSSGRAAVVLSTGGPNAPSGGSQWSTERRRNGDFGLHGVQIMLRNGGSAQWQWQRDVSVEWLAQAAVPTTAGQAGARGTGSTGAATAAGAAASSGRLGLSQQLIWLPSGQQLQVHASWPGGTKPVAVDVDVDERVLQPAASGNLPQPLRRRFQSSLAAPLGAWTTLARSAAGADGDAVADSGGSLSTMSQRPVRTLLQMRVSVVGGLAPNPAAGRR